MEKLNKLVLLTICSCLLSYSFGNISKDILLQHDSLYKKHETIDSIHITSYNFISTHFNLMHQIIIDSCLQRFNCSKLEYAWVSVVANSLNNLTIRIQAIRNSPYIPLYPKSIKDIASFDVNNTTFLIDKRSVDSLTFFNTATYQKTFLINKDSIKYECLNEMIEGKPYDVIFSFDFIINGDDKVNLEGYGILVDSGDVGFYEKNSIWKRIRIWFQKLF